MVCHFHVRHFQRPAPANNLSEKSPPSLSKGLLLCFTALFNIWRGVLVASGLTGPPGKCQSAQLALCIRVCSLLE